MPNVIRPDSYSVNLLLAFFWAGLVTVLLKTAPITLLKENSIPAIARRWLDYVPVAVMAALVGPDIFIYDGKLDFGWRNLFLMVSAPTIVVAWFSKNYFITIAFGLALIIGARYMGWAA
ncbi:MAG: AzlD domain-containing protein [Desulfovibrio sp.]|nr:AzlD domain-containing protein [Desulfovibrio sp.]